MARRTIVVPGPVYHSPGDETAFFAWLILIQGPGSSIGPAQGP